MSHATSLQSPLPLFDELPQIVMEDDTARTRKTDPVESHEAADSISKGARADSKAAVLKHIRDHAPYCAVESWRIERDLGGRPYSPSRLRTALAELERDGLVRRNKGAGVTPSGRKCATFEVAS